MIIDKQVLKQELLTYQWRCRQDVYIGRKLKEHSGPAVVQTLIISLEGRAKLKRNGQTYQELYGRALSAILEVFRETDIVTSASQKRNTDH